LDCSGFVTWALLNGGLDIGDIGAGENANLHDLDDLGEKVYITNELMNSGRVKPGDLIGLNGHMAILTGWDNNNYYIAESLNTTGGVVMTVVPKDKLVGKSMYKYIILMDNVYKKDGNLTTIW
jgi:cell wall-associated NlpC family hydrolase